MALQTRRPEKMGGLFTALRKIQWGGLLLLTLTGIPVLACFCISAAIEMIVFQSILTGMGLQRIAVFLALALELFKLVIPFILLTNARTRASWQNILAVTLRVVLVFVSFSCTFIAISNNLVDVNADAIAARDQTIRMDTTQAFQAEYREKVDATNQSTGQEVTSRTELYAIEDRQAQLDVLNQAYADLHDWATYGLIVEMNETIAQAQKELNAELGEIESRRVAQLARLEQQYSPTVLEEKISAALERARGITSYDESMNPSIGRVIYLIKMNFGIELSYESLVLLVAVLICFASECIIWTGSTNLAQRYHNRCCAEKADPFAEEVLRRAVDSQSGEGSAGIPEHDVTPLIVFDERLMDRLVRRERVRLQRNLDLTLMKEEFSYREEKRRLRREAREKKREERQAR